MIDRDLIVKEARKLAHTKILLHNVPQRGACLFFAAAVCSVLKNMGHRAILQAGSMQWPRIPLDQDDGIIFTHFSYMWDKTDPITIARLLAGEQPELHCWAALMEPMSIIDITTKYMPEQCLLTTGLEWTAPIPPDYFWNELGVDLWPEKVVYNPAKDAIDVALWFLACANQKEKNK